MGDVLTGKVTGIQPYGAFVALDEYTQGLVHISEITYGFVKDVSDFLSVGDEIEVKVLDVDTDQKNKLIDTRAAGSTVPPKKGYAATAFFTRSGR